MIGSQPSIPSAISVLVRFGNLWIDFAASRINFSNLVASDEVMLCHNSAPYKTTGNDTFSTRDDNMDGLTNPVSLSIAKTENRDARPF